MQYTYLFGHLAGNRRRQPQLVVCVETKSVNITLLSQNHGVISGCSNLRAVMGGHPFHYTGDLKQKQSLEKLQEQQ